MIWGIVPAAGAGSRIQPLAFSKELLPVGSRVVAGTTEEALAAVDLGPERLARIGRAARERVLAEHSAARRAEQLLDAVVIAASSRARAPVEQHGAAGGGA